MRALRLLAKLAWSTLRILGVSVAFRRLLFLSMIFIMAPLSVFRILYCSQSLLWSSLVLSNSFMLSFKVCRQDFSFSRSDPRLSIGFAAPTRRAELELSFAMPEVGRVI